MQAEVSVRRPEHPTKRSGPASSLRRVSTSRVLAGVAVMLLVSTAVILGGVYYMLVQFGDELDSELDTQVQTVQRDFDRDVRRLRDSRSETTVRSSSIGGWAGSSARLRNRRP